MTLRRIFAIALLAAVLTVGVKVALTQSPLLVQETVSCTQSSSTMSCTYPSNVTAGNTLVIGWAEKRGANPVVGTKSDTLGVTWVGCQALGPNVNQGVSGEICAGFPTSGGAETVTWTATSGTFTVANVFVSEWKPQLFFPCNSTCTYLPGIPNCCSGGTTVPYFTASTSGYVNNFSIAVAYATFSNTCSGITWSTPSAGNATLLDSGNNFIAYAFQPNTSGSSIDETLNCGSGNTGSIVWGGGIFSSTYQAGGIKHRRQIY